MPPTRFRPDLLPTIFINGQRMADLPNAGYVAEIGRLAGRPFTVAELESWKRGTVAPPVDALLAVLEMAGITPDLILSALDSSL